MNIFRNILSAFGQNFKNFFEENFVRPHAPELTKSGRPRLAYIDLAKGICIVLVIIQHSDVLPGNILGLRCLRMPLYFFLSGLFFRDYGSAYRFLIKKFNRLVVPFFFFLTIGGLVEWTFKNAEGTPYEFLNIYTDVFTHPYSWIAPNAVLWFLESLLVANILFWIANRVLRHSSLILGFSLLVGAVGVEMGRNELFLPFHSLCALIAFPFFTLGVLSTKGKLLNIRPRPLTDLIIGVVLLGGSCMIAVIAEIDFDVHRAYMSASPILTYAVSSGMIFGLIALCRFANWLPVISYVGRYSLIVLGLHFLILVSSEALFPSFGPHGTIGPFLASFWGSWIAIPFMKGLFPHFTAQTDLIPSDSFRHIFFRKNDSKSFFGDCGMKNGRNT